MALTLPLKSEIHKGIKMNGMEQNEQYLIKGNEWKIKECNVFFFFLKKTNLHTHKEE